jgi:predicted MPP superfamily phosphohydrolase
LALDIPPYIMQVTTDGACVRWRTDANSDSLLEYGKTPGNLSRTSYTVGPGTDHEECITGLGSGEKWYYRVGATGDPLAGGDLNHFIRTDPGPDYDGHVRIWFVSDIHAAANVWLETISAYQDFAAGRPAHIILSGGDSFGSAATDAEIETTMASLEEVTRHSAWWPTMGNHDVTGEVNYFSLMTLPTAGESGGAASSSEAYYSFDFANIHFMAINGVTGSYSLDLLSDQHNWILADLAANTQDWLIVFQHYPAYSKGWVESDTNGVSLKLRDTVLPNLESNGLDLFLTGHDHSYQRSYLIDGHYGVASTYSAATHQVQEGSGGCCGRYYLKTGGGPTANQGAVYVVLGSYSMIEQAPPGTYDHPANIKNFHSGEGADPCTYQAGLVIDIQQDLLDAHVVRCDGFIMDAFQIRKSDP